MVKDLKRLSAVLIVLLIFPVFACHKAAPKVSYLQENSVILAFGDSLTFGIGAEGSEDTYPAVLQKLINRKVINAGVSGEVTAKGIERLPGLLDEYKPSLLILCHGGNDLMRKLGDEKAADNIRAMIRMAKESGVDVVLLGVPRLSLTSMSAAGFYKEIAEEFNIPYDNHILFDIVSNASLKSDYIHPNVKGYRMMAEAVAELLLNGGAIEHINVID
ncbi:MAG: arylesterase [Thermodesulfovibrionia bacterium]|nr:arylesterase [Thermodesulfovibrionia bacterium]